MDRCFLKEEFETFVIAEAGVNHNGRIQLAKKLVDAALNAGADAVKFQTFKAERIACRHAERAKYQMDTQTKAKFQLDMLKAVELDEEAHKSLAKYCSDRDILFMSSAFDVEGVELLESLSVQIFKIPSGEITNLPYLRKIGALGKEVILSTGMAEMREIKQALEILQKSRTPLEHITVLHCNTEYPTPMADVNLKAMKDIADSFNVKVGYSDHTLGIEVAIAAVALGATVIEKHITLDRKMDGPDHMSSLEPEEFRQMVHAIRNIEIALGSNIKRVTSSEVKNISLVRKSIVAARRIKMGERFTEENITTKRPGTGMSPLEWDRVLGKTAKRDFARDEFIEL